MLCVCRQDPRERLILSLKREIKILRQENHYLRQQVGMPSRRLNGHADTNSGHPQVRGQVPVAMTTRLAGSPCLTHRGQGWPDVPPHLPHFSHVSSTE